jgi:hypothetical protein
MGGFLVNARRPTASIEEQKMNENRRLDHDLEFKWGFIPG